MLIEYLNSKLQGSICPMSLKKKIVWCCVAIIVIVIGGLLVGPMMSRVEKPSYQVISQSKNIEMRQYGSMIIAEVRITGKRKEAINNGFRLLADYIFGNNLVEEKIAMTAPVQQQPGKKIAMTAPVQQQSNGDDWLISFIMPSEYTLDDLPKPNNPQVQLKEIPAEKFIVIRFSGNSDDDNISKHEQQLLAHITEQQIQVVGSPKYAFYNPPWTLPVFRRNEIMLEVE